MNAPPLRQTMNGKPVFRVPVKTVLNLDSGFKHKLLCDGPALSLGDACAYSCSFCYVPAQFQKLDRVSSILKREGLRHDQVVILRDAALGVLEGQLVHPNGKPRWRDESDRRVVYSSPADDVAANLDLVNATVDACKLILRTTCWQIRLLSKSNLLPLVAYRLQDHGDREGAGFTAKEVRERMIFGFSTGTIDDGIARAFEQGTPLVSKRIKALHELQDCGFRTFGMVCPSLTRPLEDYDHWAREVAQVLRPDKVEHVWTEVINLRGDSFKRTVEALKGAGYVREAADLYVVSTNAHAWETYNRQTFNAHAAVYAPWAGKLRHLTYTTPATAEWWSTQVRRGAVPL